MIRPALLVCAAALLAAAPALAEEPAAAPQLPPAGASIRDDAAAWIADPHIHAFYELSRATFAHGADHVDQAAYTRQAFAIFRDFGASQGMPPEQMVEHLKRIPGEVAQIVRADPSVLDSYAAFTVALVGPQ